MENKQWFVYLLECNDGSFYTGVTNDIEKRMKAHKEGKGSKYILQRGLKKLLRTKKCSNRSQALKKEYQIKQLPKSRKLSFFN